LEVIKDESANEDAFTIFDNITQADAFHKAIKNKDLTDKEQKKLAKKVKKRIKGNSGSAGSTTERIVKRIVDQELDGVDEFESTLNDIVLDIDQITIQAKSLNKKIGELNGKLLDLDILELKHIKTIFALQSFSELSDSIIKLTSYFNNKQLNS